MFSPKFLHWLLLIVGFLSAYGCATLPANTNRYESVAYTDTADTFLGQARALEKSNHQIGRAHV